MARRLVSHRFPPKVNEFDSPNEGEKDALSEVGRGSEPEGGVRLTNY